MIHLSLLTFRSLITAVICDPSAQPFINSSHCVDKTRAGASARVKSATNTTSGLRSKRLISVFDVTPEEKELQNDTHKNNNVLYHGMSVQPQLKQEAGITSRHHLPAQRDTSDISYNTRNNITCSNKAKVVVNSLGSLYVTEELMFFFSAAPAVIFGCGA